MRQKFIQRQQRKGARSASQMSKERKPAVEDPGLRELSEGDLDALERLTGSYEQQAPHAWRRVRDLITDERLRRERMMRARLKPGDGAAMITNRIILIRIAKKAACAFVTLRPGGSTLVVRSDN